MDALNKKDNITAINSFEKVSSEDTNYNDAQTKLQIAKNDAEKILVASANSKRSKKDFDGAVSDLESALNYTANTTEINNLINETQTQKSNYEAEQEEALRKQEVANYKSSCRIIPYKVLKKNPDSMIGEKVKLKGKITQIMEENNETFMLVSVTNLGYGLWDDSVAVNIDGTIEAYEDDIIVLYGEITGSFSYTSVAGWEITIPGVLAKYIN